MFNFQKFIKPQVFGLDLSSPIIRVAQMPNEFASGANIAEALKKVNIKTKYVNACLPEAECFVRLVPKNGNIQKEVESNIPLPLSEIYYDWLETPKGLFIAAAKKKVIEKQIDLLKKAGLIIQALEPESIATARALIKNNDASLIIKLDSKKALFIVCADEIVRFSAMSSLEKARDYLDFYQTHNGQIIKIILCGNNNLEEASHKLKSFNLPIEIAKNPYFSTAIGLTIND